MATYFVVFLFYEYFEYNKGFCLINIVHINLNKSSQLHCAVLEALKLKYLSLQNEMSNV